VSSPTLHETLMCWMYMVIPWLLVGDEQII
jgi:hypothetical protein